MSAGKPPCTYVLLAHPEPRSFNGTWAQASRTASADAGHKVLFHDLVAAGFDPVERAGHYRRESGDADAHPFDPLAAQDLAARDSRLPPEVAIEIDRLRAADTLILHFPLWWFGPPAILKGWFDRCLVHGALHTSTERFDAGRCSGKRALFCVSTGSTAAESSPGGKEADATMLLWPLAYALRYLGYTVLKPELVHGVHGFHEGEARATLEERLAQEIDNQHDLIRTLDQRETLRFNRDDEFDREGILKAKAPSHSPFIRHA